ncbi:MAG: hypothetical protein K2X47_20360 [Bdellovibrionales bacterium]|nr:hypothetical protein [Bdellovibrionales bacterium]
MGHLKQITAIGLVLLLPMAFNHCGRADFQSGSNGKVGLESPQGGPAEPPIVDPVDPEVIAQRCGAGTPQTKDVEISFPENKKELCAWDNTAEIERHFGAMRSEKQSFTLPEGSTLCDLSIESNNQEFQYDDYFVISLNQFVLAASEAVPLQLSTDQRNPMVYDWTKLKDKPFNPSNINTDRERSDWDAKIWCARGTSGVSILCEFPASDTQGKVRLNLPDKVFQSIVANNPKKTKHDIELILIGDNDKSSGGNAIDCAHKKIDLKLRATFVQTP